MFVLTHRPPGAGHHPAITFLSGDVSDAVATATAAAAGKYGDATLAGIPGRRRPPRPAAARPRCGESFSPVADGGQVHLPLACPQGGGVIWATAGRPDLPPYAATGPHIERW